MLQCCNGNHVNMIGRLLFKCLGKSELRNRTKRLRNVIILVYYLHKTENGSGECVKETTNLP